MRALSVENIADRLNDRFRLLTGGNRTALPRQQTLRALIDWSHDLLDGAGARRCSGGSRCSPADGRSKRRKRWAPAATSGKAMCSTGSPIWSTSRW